MLTDDLSEQLKSRRRRAGLSLSEAARRAGTSASTLSRYENGWDRFEVYTLRKLATALGCRLTIRLDPIAGPREHASRAEAVHRLGRLFWDHPLCDHDLDEHPVWVLERVLEYGSLEDVRILMGVMGRERFLDGVCKARLSSPKTRRFWEKMLALEGRTCTRKYCRDTAWSC